MALSSQPKILELFTDMVFLVGNGWYFPGIYYTNTKENLGWYILNFKFLAGAPFSLQKGGLWIPFGALSPPFEKKEFPTDSFKKRVPRILKKDFLPNSTGKQH
jgi:hypothetical protein